MARRNETSSFAGNEVFTSISDGITENARALHVARHWSEKQIEYVLGICEMDRSSLQGRFRFLDLHSGHPVTDTLQGYFHLAVDLVTGRKVAIKSGNKHLVRIGSSRKGVRIQEDIVKETRLLKRISKDDGTRHAGFCQFVDDWETPTSYYLVAEYGGCGYFEFLRCAVTKHFAQRGYGQKRNHSGIGLSIRDWQLVMRYHFRQLVDTVFYFHTEAGIAHLDLSLENTVIDQDGHLRIIDLGLAHDIVGNGHAPRGRAIDPQSKWKGKEFVGKNDYMAPEVQNLGKYVCSRTNATENVPSGEYYDTRKEDTWCLGNMLFRMCFFMYFPYNHPHDYADLYCKNSGSARHVSDTMHSLETMYGINLDDRHWGNKDKTAAVETIERILKAEKDRITIEDLKNTDYVAKAPLVLPEELKPKIARLYAMASVEAEDAMMREKEGN